MTTLRLNTPIDDAETQMRRALRVTTPSGGALREPSADARGTRRFAQNGDVPVTRVTARKEHPNALALTIAEDALQAERTAREQAEAALTQANATIVVLQTKLAHAEMARSETSAAERTLRDALAASEAALLDQAKVVAAAVDTTPRRTPSLTPDPAARIDPAGDAEQEPVQWWVPGWKGTYRSP